ncbi:DUF3050 domain-containing protein [Psychroserpens sp. Hel_I_66]|uniref:DUF3050 domain-containing protein n=1 Tax=Psychroserpens sp. Hel_I_66 TaxID=1250004 RepID=UPI0006480ACB|nr:DUF3050 domain-containing protein [Psychroserpens sp. Hel_I_66]
MNIQQIENELVSLRAQLKNHKLYSEMSSLDDIKIFMEQHVFAVWDFMSLLKSLQNKLTCTTTPWLPSSKPKTARFINEIVMGEETDLNELGEPKSHFEMYLDAMSQIGANTDHIENFIKSVENKNSINTALQTNQLAVETQNFVTFTFDIIDTDQSHKIASAFTFGREDVIPDMFFEILNQSQISNASYSKLLYYLNRHIELDGDEHGPLSLKMIEELCGTDQQKWQDVLSVAKSSLQHRIALWDGITKLIGSQKTTITH